MSPCSMLQNSAFFPWEFWRSGQYPCKHNSDESPGRFLLRMRLKLVMGRVSEDLGKRKHDQSIITWLRIGHSWGKMPWYTIRENKSSQTYSYRGSWWHSNSREASAETEPLLQCRDHGIKRNMGGGIVTLKVIWRRGLSSLLTHLKNFMASRIRQEKEITSFDLLCDI